jgi:exodeoxyribonuclease VII large subunit
MHAALQQRQQRFTYAQTRLNVQHPSETLPAHQQQLAGLQRRLIRATQLRTQHAKQHLHSLLQTLHVVSPLATLERGYSIISNDDQQIIRSVQTLQPAQTLQARLADGYLTLRVENITPKSDI